MNLALLTRIVVFLALVCAIILVMLVLFGKVAACPPTTSCGVTATGRHQYHSNANHNG